MTPIQEEIEAFCRYYSISFYRMGCPENWDDPTVFRAGDNGRYWGDRECGLTIELKTVREWVDHPPFLAECI